MLAGLAQTIYVLIRDCSDHCPGRLEWLKSLITDLIMEHANALDALLEPATAARRLYITLNVT